MSKKARNSEGCSIDMTPMIDVVFQMIIFFIVTITIVEARDKEVMLEYGPNGELIKKDPKISVLVIDVGPTGRITLNNSLLGDAQLASIVRRRTETRPDFQVWVRGDYRTRHSHIKHVMDICTANGVGRIHVISVADPRTPATRSSFNSRGIKWR
ncbi:MAG: biopolymer transporter ExbD [Kiritimatiellaeota bacterium]|nr:biopolymer transporter ExbD [Kiritimatiellota bacterium]